MVVGGRTEWALSRGRTPASRSVTPGEMPKETNSSPSPAGWEGVELVVLDRAGFLAGLGAVLVGWVSARRLGRSLPPRSEAGGPGAGERGEQGARRGGVRPLGGRGDRRRGGQRPRGPRKRGPRGGPRNGCSRGAGAVVVTEERGSLGGSRDRHRQDGPAGLRLRRHRDRPVPAHPRPGRRRHLVGDRRLPLRPAADRRRDGRRRLARAPRSRSASSAAWGASTSKGSGPATRTPTRCSRRSPTLDAETATKRMQEIYAEPIKEELIGQRIREIKEAGVTAGEPSRPSGCSSTQRPVLDAGSSTCSSSRARSSARARQDEPPEPLNLKKFIATYDIPVIVGGCASYSTALHLMRTGAVGVLVGVGPGTRAPRRGVLGIGVPQATAIADAAGARMRHLDETGRLRAGDRRRWHAHRWRHRQGHRLRRRRRDDRLAAHERRRGARPRLPLGHGDLPPHAAPRRARQAGRTARSPEILIGPAHENDGTLNLFGALRTSMATTGYETLKEFQKAEVMVAPALLTEGKNLSAAGTRGHRDGRRHASPSTRPGKPGAQHAR